MGNIGGRQWWLVKATPPPLYPRESCTLLYPLYRRLSGPRGFYGWDEWREEIYAILYRPLKSEPPSLKGVSVLTTLSHLSQLLTSTLLFIAYNSTHISWTRSASVERIENTSTGFYITTD